MCVIIGFEPKAKIPFDRLETAVLNNPHGFGLILKDNDRLQSIRECSEKGNDPEKIAKLLEEHEDIERFLHVRWKTKGPVDLDNTHPFPVYNSNSRQIFFMHNGSLHPWGNDNVSDSRQFAEDFLSELLLRYEGEDGKGDIQDPMFQKIVEKFWSGGSRGLLVSNNQLPMKIGSGWKDFRQSDGVPGYVASNDDYFEKLKRGPVFEQRKTAEEAKRRSFTPSPSKAVGFVDLENPATFGARNYPVNSQTQGQTQTSGIISLSDILKTGGIDEEIQSRIEKYFNNYQMFEEEGLEVFTWLTEVEIEDFISKHIDNKGQPSVELTWFLVWVFQKLSDLKTNRDNAETKHHKATKMIADLQKEINLLKEGTENE